METVASLIVASVVGFGLIFAFFRNGPSTWAEKFFMLKLVGCMSGWFLVGTTLGGFIGWFLGDDYGGWFYGAWVGADTILVLGFCWYGYCLIFDQDRIPKIPDSFRPY